MTEQDLTITVTQNDLTTLLESTLPEGPGYGRREVNEQSSVSDIHGTPILAAGQPCPRRGRLMSALAENAMTVKTIVWGGLEQEPTSVNVFWGSRFGTISATKTQEQTTTLTLRAFHTLYEQLVDAIGLGPRAAHTNTAELRVKQRLLDNITPDAEAAKRRAALDELVQLTAQPMPEISSLLAAGHVRFVAFSIKRFSLEGKVEQDLFWLDTPAGILVPTTTGGFLVRAKLAVIPPWAVWQNIVEQLPDTQDIALWHDLAEDTATDRVAFDPQV